MFQTNQLLKGVSLRRFEIISFGID